MKWVCIALIAAVVLAACSHAQVLLSKRAIKNCFTVCAAVWAPICGSDGKTYSNGCAMRSQACVSGKKITMKSMGECGAKSLFGKLNDVVMKSKRAITGCASICPAVYSPVCGSNGRRYSHSCRMSVDACRSGKKIISVSLKQCGGGLPALISKDRIKLSKRQRCPSFCIEIYSPVCGSDGLTYGNDCKLNIAKCNSGGRVRLVSRGSCKSSSTPFFRQTTPRPRYTKTPRPRYTTRSRWTLWPGY